MTVDDASRGRSAEPPRSHDATLSWAAVAAASSAVVAWAACCVLPMTLALAGLGLGGLGWMAGHRISITLMALALIGAGWALTWRRARLCRIDRPCPAPTRLGIRLLSAATFLVLLALAWQPLIEPSLLALLQSARG